MCEVCLSGLAGWDNWWETAFTHVIKKGNVTDKVCYKAKSSNEGSGGGVAKRGGTAQGFTVKGLRERAIEHVEGNIREFCRRKNISGMQRFWTCGAGVRTPRGLGQPNRVSEGPRWMGEVDG